MPVSLASGRELLAIPGPTPVPDPVLQAMHRPAIDIYDGELVGVTESIRTDLKTVFATETGTVTIYAANGHGAWESALTNTLSRGDRILIVATGRFGPAWGEMARVLGLEVELLDAGYRGALDPQRLEDRLRADAAHEFKAVLAVQVDTATSVVNDIAALRQAIDAAGHPALFMTDLIACLATVPFEMDAWGVDVAVAGSQKGLMTPPGLSYTAWSPKAWAAHKTADLVTQYWDWTFREGDEHYMKHCGTPPEHLLFGQRAALDILLGEGMPQVFERHRVLARAVRAAVACWAEGGALAFNVTEPAHRADCVTTVLMPAENGAATAIDAGTFRTLVAQRLGVMVGGAIGALSGKGFRIAHMGHVNAGAILGVLGAVEAGLKAAGIPHESGLAAAAAEIGAAVAG